MNIIWRSVVFNPTGIATSHRGFLKQILLHNLANVHLQDEHYRKGLGEEWKKAFQAIDVEEPQTFIMNNYYEFMRDTSLPAKNVAYMVHEGNKIPAEKANQINDNVEHILVPSLATKRLFASSGVRIPISIVPEGIDPIIFTPEGSKGVISIPDEYKDAMIFCTVNSWTGVEGDRKGTEYLLRAWSKAFTKDEKVLLYFKIGTFFLPPFDVNQSMNNILQDTFRHPIVWDNTFKPEEHLAAMLRASHCFVTATRAESWGLSIGEAMGCGLPVIVPNNPESGGYMDYVPSDNFFCKTGEKVQADTRYFVQGNTMPTIDIDDLAAQMHKAYELFKSDPTKLKEIGMRNSEKMKEYTWEKSARKLIEALQ